MNLPAALVLPACLLAMSSQALPAKELHTPFTFIIESAEHTPGVLVFTGEHAKPKKSIAFSQGIDMIIKGIGLNIDHIRFVKEPKATDYCVHANNKAAYAKSLIIAANNGIKLDRDMRMETKMTREQFATRLHEAILATGNYPVTLNWLIIKDEAAFSPDALNAVQTLVKFNVVTLEKGSYRPKALITELEAATMVKKAVAFIKAHKPVEAAVPQTEDEVTFQSTPVNDSVNRVVLSRGEKPNSGYQIMITSIVFPAKGQAEIHYKLTDPAPGNSYLQVITTATAETYVAAGYQVSLKEDK